MKRTIVRIEPLKGSVVILIKGELIDFLEARWHQMKSKAFSEMEHVLMKDYESKNNFWGNKMSCAD